MAHATSEQMAKAFLALSDDELVAIKKAARRGFGGTEFETAEEVTQEAMTRFLDGSRKWDPRSDLPRCFAGAINSIAYAKRRSEGHSPLIGADLDALLDMGVSHGLFTESTEDIVQRMDVQIIVAKAANSARSRLSNDPVALRVLDSMLAGDEPSETCRKCLISNDGYRAARKRVLAAMKRALGPMGRELAEGLR